MPNIYLRMPSSRCEYFRHRDPTHILRPDEPLVFSTYSEEYYIIRSNLSNANAVTQNVNLRCFSHQQWTNMLHGRSPLGGRAYVNRDKSEYLTFAQVQWLNGRTDDTSRTPSEDYLCIKLPSEVLSVDTVRTVTPSWCLTDFGVRQLLVALNNDFKRHIVEWMIATFDLCTEDGRIVIRQQIAALERFMMRYGIEPSQKEKDNLRRVIDRWLRTEHKNLAAYSCVDMQYVDPNERIINVAKVIWT